MKGWQLEAATGIEALALCELPVPVPGPGEVLIEVHACGLNFSDLLMAAGSYQVRPSLPFVPGQEIAGRVVAVAPGAARKAGERVATKVTWGGFAEFAVAREDMLITLPAAMSLAAGATLPVVWPTAWIALFERAALAAGEHVFVHAAAGAVGNAAVQLARAAGAVVIAGVGDLVKAPLALAAGAAHVVSTAAPDWTRAVNDLSGGRGVDVVFDPVGGDAGAASLRCLARGGRHLIVGFASGALPRLAANRLLLKNASALGVYWSHEHDGPLIARALKAILELRAAGSVVIDAARVVRFDRLKAALDDLAARRTTGKCVLAVKEEMRT